MSQPAREFVVKIIELSLWSSDLLLGHFLLFMMTPPILVPYIDRLHATLLCEFFQFVLVGWVTNGVSVWLRPSKQIRPPLYSIKQKRQRRWIVSTNYLTSLRIWDFLQIIKYGTIYMSMITLFVALIALRKPFSILLRVQVWLTINLQPLPSGARFSSLAPYATVYSDRTLSCIPYIHLYFFTLHGHSLCFMTLVSYPTVWRNILRLCFCPNVGAASGLSYRGGSCRMLGKLAVAHRVAENLTAGYMSSSMRW